MTELIYHITARAAWVAAQGQGRYSAPSLASEGFMHCSTRAQVVPVAEKFYKGQAGLVLLVIDPARLVSPLKWEAPSDGTPPPGVAADGRFPHIYGPLNLNAVVRVLDFAADGKGVFSLPAGAAA
jgi:uncharacterized protein (DUF952 family)